MKKVLIICDFQNDFISGALGFPKAAKLVAPIVAKIKQYQEENADLIFMFDTHDENYLNTQEGKNLPIKHTIKDTHGWEAHPEVVPFLASAKNTFYKHAFGSIELGQYLKEQNYEIIELVGLVSNICILSNSIVAKASLPEATVIVDATCTASYDDDLHEKALDILQGVYIQVINR